jgi:hypothetical protein
MSSRSKHKSLTDKRVGLTTMQPQNKIKKIMRHYAKNQPAWVAFD